MPREAAVYVAVLHSAVHDHPKSCIDDGDVGDWGISADPAAHNAIGRGHPKP